MTKLIGKPVNPQHIKMRSNLWQTACLSFKSFFVSAWDLMFPTNSVTLPSSTADISSGMTVRCFTFLKCLSCKYFG